MISFVFFCIQYQIMVLTPLDNMLHLLSVGRFFIFWDKAHNGGIISELYYSITRMNYSAIMSEEGK